jgi:DNA-binding transcriptional ArsR family regulator
MFLEFRLFRAMKSRKCHYLPCSAPTEIRLAIVRSSVEAGPEGLSVARIGEHLAHSDATAAPATLSLHLKKLRRAGFIDSRQEARFIQGTSEQVIGDRVVTKMAQIWREAAQVVFDIRSQAASRRR